MNCVCGRELPQMLSDGNTFVCECGRSLRASVDTVQLVRRIDELEARIKRIETGENERFQEAIIAELHRAIATPGVPQVEGAPVVVDGREVGRTTVTR